MRWKRARRSDNVVDARGGGRGLRIGGGLGVGGIAIVTSLWNGWNQGLHETVQSRYGTPPPPAPPGS